MMLPALHCRGFENLSGHDPGRCASILWNTTAEPAEKAGLAVLCFVGAQGTW